ncbi:MAG: XRE family transcriptional regulator [Bdellovibrionota bacterium]
MMKPKKVSQIPPSDWPTDKEWKAIEKDLLKTIPSLILPINASPVDRIKYDLCEQFVRYCIAKNINQRKLAIKLGIGEARVSEIVHYRYQRFTIDKLVKLLSIIKPSIKLKVA